METRTAFGHRDDLTRTLRELDAILGQIAQMLLAARSPERLGHARGAPGRSWTG